MVLCCCKVRQDWLFSAVNSRHQCTDLIRVSVLSLRRTVAVCQHWDASGKTSIWNSISRRGFTEYFTEASRTTTLYVSSPQKHSVALCRPKLFWQAFNLSRSQEMGMNFCDSPSGNVSRSLPVICDSLVWLDTTVRRCWPCLCLLI